MAAPTSTVPFSVAGKSAIVTGAGSGINFCFAKLLLSKGCNVLFADLALRPEAQKVLDNHCGGKAQKPRAIFLKTDVTDWVQLRNMFEVADREFGDFQIVCPGAGVFEPHWSNFWHPPGSDRAKDSPEGGRYAVLDVNITHPIRATQLALEYFLSPKRGSKVSALNPKRILHVSSIAAQDASLFTPMYYASKHAVSAFVHSLAALEPTIGVRVNGVAPGIIKTPLWTDHPEKIKYFNDEQDEWASPEEVAEAMLACLEDDDLPGGTVLEVGHNSRRKVPLRNNPGPAKAPGLTISDTQTGINEVLGWLAEPNWGKAKL
ncbi:putative short chain dehydrogenase/ reductase [Delphinella strobiligena]|nr:putative short chain dehydrogenase/ reductase [Delphinella strobiligena]